MSKRSTINLDSLRERTASLRPSQRREAAQQGKPRKPLWIERKVRHWGGRLLGGVSGGGFAAQEEIYDSHQTSRDFLWNTVGLTCWGIIFPVLTIVITQLVGTEQAGMFSLAFVAGQLLMILANYGVRTYQVSDREQQHSFIDYQANRWITCILMLVVGWLFCSWRGYDASMRGMTMAVFVYKMVDGMADVYEGRLQQMDKLYLAGISQTIRSVSVLAVFSFFLLITRSLGVASAAMAVAAVLSLVLFTVPLALLETPNSEAFSLRSLGALFAHCAPVFAALFLYSLIDNMPKFVMESMLPYDNQLYFNAMQFPAHAILMIVGFLYKPLLTRMADAWNDLSRRSRFDLFILAAIAVIAAITAAGVGLMAWIGIPIMSALYGIDFEPFRKFSYLMIFAGGIIAAIDFLYQVVTVMRRQAVVAKLYLITFAFALVVPNMLIRVSELEGAIMSYIIIMAILLVLLALEYIGVRLSYQRHPEDDPTYVAAASAASMSNAYGMPAREAVRAERIAREGGEVDAQFAARRSLAARQRRRAHEAPTVSDRAAESGPDGNTAAMRRLSGRTPTPRQPQRPSVKGK